LAETEKHNKKTNEKCNSKRQYWLDREDRFRFHGKEIQLNNIVTEKAHP
jgi:hypothetical protein